MHKIELLAPAGDLEKLKEVIASGADAVYIGGEIFGTKSSINYFSKENMIEGVKFAHERGKKVYVYVNVIPHNEDFMNLDEYLLELKECDVDAVVIGDPGVLGEVQRVLPDIEIYLSDQANTTNYVTAKFWYNQGIKRVALSKELSLDEIAQIRAKTPLDLELEAFVHGEMCISYSGRCLISNFLKGKEAKDADNLDMFKYSLVEEKRPGEYYPVYEDKGGTFLFNSKDLCMVEHIEDVIKSGLTTLKIEGRMKSKGHISTIVKIYREAIDKFYEDPQNYEVNHMWLEEIKKNTHREYTTGFYLDEMKN
ncbi:MAG: peptidase U32 family protein [Romboutsia sp.]